MHDAGEPTRLGLEVRFDAQPIHGRLFACGGEEDRLDRAFSGWLGLIAALEAARRLSADVPTEHRGAA
jgi:hypothetical protein